MWTNTTGPGCVPAMTSVAGVTGAPLAPSPASGAGHFHLELQAFVYLYRYKGRLSHGNLLHLHESIVYATANSMANLDPIENATKVV